MHGHAVHTTELIASRTRSLDRITPHGDLSDLENLL